MRSQPITLSLFFGMYSVLLLSKSFRSGHAEDCNMVNHVDVGVGMGVGGYG